MNEAPWTGLSVGTLAGDAFALRVAASLLAADDTPELASRGSADYIETAISPARTLGRAHDRTWSIPQAGEVPRACNVEDAG